MCRHCNDYEMTIKSRDDDGQSNMGKDQPNMTKALSTPKSPSLTQSSFTKRNSVVIIPSSEVTEPRRVRSENAGIQQPSPTPEASSPPKSHRPKARHSHSHSQSRGSKKPSTSLPAVEWYPPSPSVIDPRLTKNQTLLLLFARALMTHGAPLARTEVQLVELARILKVVVEVLRLPGGLICTFFDRSVELIPRRTARTHYLKVGGRLNMENLRRIHSIYMLVCKGFTNAEAATEELLNIGVRLRGGEWSTGLTRQIECFLVALQDILHHRPKPILAWRRNRWERKLTNTHRVEGTVT